MLHLSGQRAALTAALLATGFIGSARADIITSLAGTPTAVAGGYAYTYNVQLSGGELDAEPAGSTITEQFGTIYDFGPVLTNADGSPIISYTGQLSNFYWTFNNSDTPAPQTAPVDNPNIANIRFYYDGTSGIAVSGEGNSFGNTSYTTVEAGDPSNLGTFTIESAYGPTLNTTAQYDGTSYKATNDTIQANVGYLSTPALPVPEPAALALLGLGLLGAGAVRRTQV